MSKPRGGSRHGSGRKAEHSKDGTSRYNVSLDQDTHDKAKLIGEGNLSAGIRKAVKGHKRKPSRGGL